MWDSGALRQPHIAFFTLPNPRTHNRTLYPCSGQRLLNRDHATTYYQGMPPCPSQHTLTATHSELALVPPLLGSSQRLLNRDHATTYYQGMPRDAASGRPLRRHGDEVQRLAGGYYRALGRCDDTMNLGGIKVCIGVTTNQSWLGALPVVT